MDLRWAPYVLRMGLAATFLLAGLDHAVDDGGMAWAVRFMPDPELWGQVLAWGELAAGIGLALGLLMPLSLGVAAFVAWGALAVLALGGGGFPWQDLVMGGAALYVLAHGNGPGALDGFLVARRPRLRRWLEPFRGPSVERMGALALRGTLGIGLLAITAYAASQGTFSATWADRVVPDLGAVVFVLRPIMGALVLAGAAPRVSGAMVLGLGAVQLAASPFDYHAHTLLAAGAALVAWPGMLRTSRARERAVRPPARSQPVGP